MTHEEAIGRSLTGRPNGNWGGTLKEELEVGIILKVIRDKCEQHIRNCRYCPFWCKNSETCLFHHDAKGYELYDNFDMKGLL